MQPQHIYARREAAYRRLGDRQRQAAVRLSNARLGVALAGLLLAVLLYRAVGPRAAWGAAALSAIPFAFLARRHGRVLRRLRYTETLAEINRTGVERIAGRWGAFPDTGAEFADDEHPFASDLDLFGQGSVFQWLSASHTAPGRAALARLLTGPPPEPGEIQARQQAVAELAPALGWRQRLEAEALQAAGELGPVEPLLEWARQSHPLYAHPLVRFGAWALPGAALLVIGLSFLGRLTWQAPVAMLALHFLLLRTGGAARSQALNAVFRQERELRTYASMLRHLETRTFSSPWLRDRQAQLRSGRGEAAHLQVRRLSRIAERISNRANAMFLILNIVLLWDIHCMISLEAWKRESGRLLPTWLRTLGEVEALASLAIVRFEHPDWAFPEIAEGRRAGITGAGMGHPLIGDGRVCNDFALVEPVRVAVITGSNMSGKSTFLRTVGVNLVLAYAGAPVCAARFACPRVQLWTCMRVEDNLQQRISAFYAEILRIKRIVEAVRGGARVCFLLDEIFKGTNSRDRHTGARALISQLQRAGAIGLVSTHDLELGELERESGGRIINYHFREYYEGNEIRFDYKLRPGISPTRNALHLIRMAGIELDEEGAP